MAYCDTELSGYKALQKRDQNVYELPQTQLQKQIAHNQEAVINQPTYMNTHCKPKPNQLQTARSLFKNKLLTAIIIMGSIALNVLLITCLTVIALQSYVEKQEVASCSMIQDLNNTAQLISHHMLQQTVQNLTQLLHSHMKSINSADELITQNLNTAIALIKSNTQNTLSYLTNVVDTLSAVKNSSFVTERIVQDMEDTLAIANNQHEVLLRPASCQEIMDSYPESTSGYYTVNGEEMYCRMGELCGSKGGWTRLAYLDMNDTTVSCPSTLSFKNSSDIRSCARPDSGSNGSCASVQFPSNSISYSEVCGRVVGYQYGDPDATSPGGSIDSPYLEGISITHGNPRQHVWSLIAGRGETYSSCPCNSPPGSSPPSFVSNNYFCESGNPTSYGSSQLYPDDPLWDGKQCGGNEANCCSAAGLPWFHKTLSTNTTDYLELRNCGDLYASDENVYINFYEIYVK